MTYSVRLSPRAVRAYKKLNSPVKLRLQGALDALQRDPTSGPSVKRLVGLRQQIVWRWLSWLHLIFIWIKSFGHKFGMHLMRRISASGCFVLSFYPHSIHFIPFAKLLDDVKSSGHLPKGRVLTVQAEIAGRI